MKNPKQKRINAIMNFYNGLYNGTKIKRNIPADIIDYDRYYKSIIPKQMRRIKIQEAT